MKKISKLAGIVAAAALLCGISGCDNSETITMTSAKIEMVGDPIVTDKAVVFQWKDSTVNNVKVTRQAPDEEEVILDSNCKYNWFADCVSRENQLKAGVEYTYRFYNETMLSSARTTEYTLETKYSCVERKVKFESIAPADTKLAPITDDQVKIVKSNLHGNYYVSVYVNEKEANGWITITDKTKGYDISHDSARKGADGFELENIEYNPTHNYEIWVGKWWNDNYYNDLSTGIKFDIAAIAVDGNDGNSARPSISSFYISKETVFVSWSGEKDSTYELSFEAVDNQGNAVTLKKSTVDASTIKHDDFYNYAFTGKVSDFITFDATTNKTSVKFAKAILKKTAKDGIVSEGQYQTRIDPSYTKYTKLDSTWVQIGEYDWKEVNYLNVDNDYDQTEDGDVNYYAVVTLSGANLPATAKLYYKKTGETNLYSEVTGGLKKDADGNLTAKVPVDYNSTYDFKAVVTTDNKNWYDWEEGKTEEVAEKTEWRY